MRVFSLKTCDTCRKALKSLRESGHAPSVIDVRSDGISPQDLTKIIQIFGEKSINKSSTTWRGLSESDRVIDPADLLAAHPTLLKRPVIEHDGEWTIGWKSDVQAVYL